ncbi:hypothetical protein PO360_03635 [Enterobacter ludwigii]|uniref:hypothetical protein n=1 Tax=Enterobacter ludwigii TaxID=299767 RepID=UPI002FFAA26A
MDSKENTFNYEALKMAAKLDPMAARFLSRLECDTYDKFILMLYKDIEATLALIEKTASLRQNDGEDRLSIEIINILIGAGYLASHDQYINGHSDIVVSFNSFTWIGEAKIHSSYDYLMEGFMQLCDRYSTGNENDCEGGLIFYIKGNNALEVVEKWKADLITRNVAGLKTFRCNNRKNLSFYSTHTHSKSGLIYKVRHFGVILGFNPTDKSARIAKKNN